MNSDPLVTDFAAARGGTLSELAAWSATPRPTSVKQRRMARIAALSSQSAPLRLDPAAAMQSMLVRMEPGLLHPRRRHPGLEHSLIRQGGSVLSGRTLHAGEYEVGGACQDHRSIPTKGGCPAFLMRRAADRVYA